MATKSKTIKEYQADDHRRILRMNAARKRKAAARHEATAARFKKDAADIEAELPALERQRQAS